MKIPYLQIYVRSSLNSQTNLGVTLNSLMEKVERTQYQAALAITGTWQGSNRSTFYEELGWETLSDLILIPKHSPCKNTD